MARRKTTQAVLVDPDELITSVDAKVNSVRTQSIDFSFNELADMYQADELIIDPEFQRMFRWPEGSQARFIESLLLELPVPPIFLIEREDRVYELIDGLQRISSYLHFRGQLKVAGELQDPLVLADCDIVKELNGLTYADLPRALEIKLKRSYIRAEILRKESDRRLRYYMFKRLNTGGEILEAQEVRNATIRLLSNEFNSFLSALSKDENFAYCVDTISDNQKLQKFDQELVLRFFSYKNDGNRYRHDVANFLTDYMEAVSDPTSDTAFDYDAERSIFERTFRALRMISAHLGINSKIFGTVDPRYPEPKSQFSVYHYEGLVLGLQPVLDRIDLENAGQIDRLGTAVMKGKFDREFLKHCGGGKNSRNELNARINYFAKAFKAAVS
ncbi:DUF262 domain-containing protein [Micromonospora sp. CV4]|uniref:GmrSD restriction endonuclease domain-containing protein n=1 Tax=Micromonospora sp. CV4 TaxID=2478711 RepID=UPI000EF45FE6|nr:DUF262 domain-containing protein [Micromonospora sp. CV4]RLP93604.1 DUF262 domain-containing protein [Micromonospora sp. CV4]